MGTQQSQQHNPESASEDDQILGCDGEQTSEQVRFEVRRRLDQLRAGLLSFDTISKDVSSRLTIMNSPKDSPTNPPKKTVRFDLTNLGSSKDSSDQSPKSVGPKPIKPIIKTKPANEPSHSTGDDSRETAKGSKPEPLPKPPDRPPPQPPSRCISTVGISTHVTRTLRDGTIVRGVQGATFGGFIPPGRALPIRLPPPVRLDNCDLDSELEHSDGEDEPLEEGEHERIFHRSPTPPDAVYFDEGSNSDDDADCEEEGIDYDKLNFGGVELFVPPGFGARPQLFERGYNTWVKEPKPLKTKPGTDMMVTGEAIAAKDTNGERRHATRSIIGPLTSSGNSENAADMSWAIRSPDSFSAEPLIGHRLPDDLADIDASVPWADEIPGSFLAGSPVGSPPPDNSADMNIEILWTAEIPPSISARPPTGPPTGPPSPGSPTYVDSKVPWTPETPRSFSGGSSLDSPLSNYMDVDSVESLISSHDDSAVADTITVQEMPPRDLKRGRQRTSSANSLELESPPLKKSTTVRRSPRNKGHVQDSSQDIT